MLEAAAYLRVVYECPNCGKVNFISGAEYVCCEGCHKNVYVNHVNSLWEISHPLNTMTALAIRDNKRLSSVKMPVFLEEQNGIYK